MIENELGLHARAAAQFVKIANQFQSEVKIIKQGRDVNAKSIMGILMLAASKGTRITIVCEGPDAEEALRELETLVKNKFGEK